MATAEGKERMCDALDDLDPDLASDFEVALQECEQIKNGPERVGLCHNFAIGIIKGLEAVKRSDGWVWSRGLVKSIEEPAVPDERGVDHSWVEYDGWGMDMGDDNEFRFWDVNAPPNFEFAGEPTRRDHAQTVAWLAAIDTVRGRLRLEDFARPEVVEAAVIVSGSPIPVPEPRAEDLAPPRAARVEASDDATGVRGVAHGFDRALTPEERGRVEALFPDHLPTWIS